MATREQIINTLAKRRFNKHYWPNRSKAQLKQAAVAMSDDKWDDILESLGNGNLALVGSTLREALIAYLTAAAVADIEGRLGVDDTLTITEMEDLF